MIPADVLEWFRGKRCVVTGGTGLIGRQVVDILCGAGAVVRVVSLDELRVDDRVEHVLGDLTEYALCRDVTRRMDCVFHVAGVKGSIEVSRSQQASHFVPTLMFNTNVLEACRLNGVPRVLYTSSIGAYASADDFRESTEEPGTFTQPPMDFAGWAKRMAELQIHAYREQYGLNTFAIVRPSNVYGPGDNFDPRSAMVVPTLLSRIRRGENPVRVWGDGSAVRDFVYSRDVAEGMILALFHGTNSRCVNLGSGEGVSVRQLVETLASFLDFSYEFDVTKPSGYPRRVMDISLARTTLGWSPSTSLADGLRTTWEWFVRHEDEYVNRHNYFARS